MRRNFTRCPLLFNRLNSQIRLHLSTSFFRIGRHVSHPNLYLASILTAGLIYGDHYTLASTFFLNTMDIILPSNI